MLSNLPLKFRNRFFALTRSGRAGEGVSAFPCPFNYEKHERKMCRVRSPYTAKAPNPRYPLANVASCRRRHQHRERRERRKTNAEFSSLRIYILRVAAAIFPRPVSH
ncbi:hypothetical protein GWI33_014515 [Rhynchophorus ferrugineus]|uniref:Uncharacterized protein n=1 Tax=Rhynchophorus ferrugineus TaxID=354439 RepID=A0A834IEZ6_RHYFE|nr:hypothetical protein GWI33_014515 [Rhynchophorus ferrugineus]